MVMEIFSSEREADISAEDKVEAEFEVEVEGETKVDVEAESAPQEDGRSTAVNAVMSAATSGMNILFFTADTSESNS